MKHEGRIMDFTHQRNMELFRAYRLAVLQCRYIKCSDVSATAVNTPCSRFWVSERRASEVIGSILNGLPVLDFMRPAKREMYTEILARTKQLREEYPNESLYDVVFRAVNTPAPKFYMHPSYAIQIIRSEKNRLRKCQQQGQQ